MEEAAAEALDQHWVRSPEDGEDKAPQEVYRPASYPFPPSRGRPSFELKPDGTLVRYGPGPADRAQSAPGRWKRDGNRLTLTYDTGAIPEELLEIISLSPDRLVVSRRASTS